MKPRNEYAEMHQKLANNLWECMDSARKELGDEFEPLMAKLSKIIFEFREKQCKPGTSFVMAGYALSIPDEDATAEDIEYSRYMRAALAWWMIQETRISREIGFELTP